MASDLHYSASIYFEDLCNVMLAAITIPLVMHEIVDNHVHDVQMGTCQKLILVNNEQTSPKSYSRKFLFAKRSSI